MKKLKFIIAAAGIVAIATACRMNKRHVVIAESNNDSTLKIEYLGRAEFNAERTRISSITPNGYVRYKKNDNSIVAESDNNGVITYQINNGDKQQQLDANGRIFLAQAVKDMVNHGHYNDGR